MINSKDSKNNLAKKSTLTPLDPDQVILVVEGGTVRLRSPRLINDEQDIKNYPHLEAKSQS